ncbi:hydroxysteroid 11-beta-dehydrogenase 1-like protein, partial [Salvelinus alpinus]|uniref:hydroxysteroid 11-beta-dehydrogenase 1-like protein n=1 Tax=Salvelinus alpinus TaxID=8036 RepID=UPI0039FD5248
SSLISCLPHPKQPDSLSVCPSPQSDRGARVLVTGASTGIGEQVAYRYSKMGGQIVITARKEHALQKVAEDSTSLGAQKALYVTGDVCQASDPERGVRMAG